MTHPGGETLSALLDGDLAPEEMAEAKAHLDSCAACRGDLARMREMVGTLASLPDREPDTELWGGIKGRIRVRFPLRTAAGILLLAGAGVVWLAMRLPVPPEENPGMSESIQEEIETPSNAAYLQAIRDQDVAFAEMEPWIAPAAAGLISRETRILDKAIGETLAALKEDPGNALVRAHLARTLEARWTYIRDAADLAPPRVPSGG